jgi:hypothetical protein
VHHPPQTAYFCKGTSGYKVWTHTNPKAKFTGRSIQVTPGNKVYVELEKWGETYQITQP